MHYTDVEKSKDTYFNKQFHLDAGIHDLEVLHEEPTGHSMRFNARLRKVGGILDAHLKSLEGNIPKIIRQDSRQK